MTAHTACQQPGFSIERKLTLAEVVGGSVGVFFITGYLIHSIFIRNYGILEAELLRPDYIVIGLTFCLLTASIVFLPLGALYLTYHVRRTSGLPHFRTGLIGNVANTIVFLGLLVFACVFVTRYEWNLPLRTVTAGISTCGGALVAALSTALFGTAIVPWLERLILRSVPQSRLIYWFWGLIEPIRFGVLIITVLLTGRCFVTFGWMGHFLIGASSYLSVLAATCAGIVIAYRWIDFIRPLRGTLPVYVLVGLGLLILYYVTITAYVFGVFNAIPTNRGGRLPLTIVTLQLDNNAAATALLARGQHGGSNLIGPVYVIEETSESLFYVTRGDMGTWLDAFVPVYSIRKDKVAARYMERIVDGFPRAPGS